MATTKQTAIIICGAPGVGKSFYGKQLAATRRAALLDIDTVTERLVRLGLARAGENPDDRDSPEFKASYREPIYDTLFEIARENLPWIDVLIAGPFTKELRQRDWPANLELILGASVEVHYLTCPAELRRERLISRGNPRDLAKLREWGQHLEYFGPEQPPVFEHISINNY